MAGQSRAANKAFAVIMAILASVLVVRGIFILCEGSYTATPRFMPQATIWGSPAFLFGLSSILSGAALASTLLYLVWNRTRAALIVGGSLGVVAVGSLVASLVVG